jgi:hypothetical protein
LNTQLFDTNRDGLVNTSDTTASGLQIGGLVRQTARIGDRLVFSGTAGTGLGSELNPLPDESGRGAWREFVQ